MLRIVSTQKRDVSYQLLAEKTYVVGRKQGDILFKDDQSISRTHAELEVQHNMGNITEPLLTPVLKVMDVGSRFGTFMTEAGGTINSNNKIGIKETVTMNVGDKVRFGLQSNEYRVVHTPLVITTSSMKAKTEFKETILKLGGHLVPEWSDLVTHVVMEAVSLTVKAVCGLLAGKPIVTPEYIDDLLASYETGRRPPQVTDYIPPVNEKEATLTEEVLKPDPSRSTLFVGKVFHFYTAKHLKRMRAAIEAGGGTVKLLSDASAEDVASLEFIILAMNVPENTIRDRRVKDLLDKYTRCGKRFLIDSEIGYAAINSSIDKFCNPKYSMIKALLPNYNLASQSQRSSAASATIVPETQDMDTQPSEFDDTRKVVNETTEESASDEDASVGSKRRGPRDASDGLASKKRSAGDVLVRPESKRLKDVPEASAPVRSAPAPSASRPTRSSPRIQITLKNQPADALSKLFEMSDSDDEDEDVERIPETQQSTGDEETLPQINIVDVRNLQSVGSTQQSRDDEVQQEEDDAIFRIPATPPSFAGPSQAKTKRVPNRGTDFIETVRTSLMDAKTVPCSSVPEVFEVEDEEESTNSNNHDVASSGSSSKGRESSRKRPREDEEDIMKGLEERAKKINLSDAKIKIENQELETEVAAPEAPLVLKPLMNKQNVRRELSFEVESIVSDGIQNFKTFKKVLPTCVSSQSGLNSQSTTSNSYELNTSIRGSNKSTKIKLGRLDYSPGKSAYSFASDEDDLPTVTRVEKSNGKAQAVVADIPSPDQSDEEVQVEAEISAEENTRNLRGGRKRLAPATKITLPQKRTSPRKKGSSSTRPVRDVTPPPVPVPMEEDDAGDDEWTFQR